MSTATTQNRNPDTKLTHPLARLSGYIRMFVIVDVMLFLGLFITLWFWLGMGIDYGLFKLTGFDLAQKEPKAYLRGFIFIGFVLLMSTLLVWRIYVLFTKEFSYPSLALLLEKRHPELLGDRLITAIELADVKKAEKQGYSAEMIEHTIAEARERVEQVSLRGVFNWRRLVLKGVGIVALLLLALIASFAIHAGVHHKAEPAKYAWAMADVSSIWLERNVLLQKTPWPRRAYVEIVTTDENNAEIFGANGDEMRLPEKSKPNVRARVFKWVHAEPGSFHGWRPLKWSDLDPKTLGFAPPSGSMTMQVGTEPVSTDLADALVDDVEYRFSKGEVSTGDSTEMQRVMDRLDAIAADPSYNRTIRKLAANVQAPASEDKKQQFPLQATLQGISTGLPLFVALSSRDPQGIFSGPVLGADNNGITESYSLTVVLEDFQTLPKTITAIPPPKIREMQRIEYHPAYLYYRAPTDGTQASLTGLKQKMPLSTISLNGEKSLLNVPIGSELELFVEADKPLSKVELVLKNAPTVEKKDAVTFPVLNTTTESGEPAKTGFQKFSFTLKNENAIRTKTELELRMYDLDNVSSTRGIDISVGEDKAPDVELGIDTMRKVGNEYWITPKAMVPFDGAGSYARDELGLRDLRFVFSWRKVESQIIDQGKSLIAAGLSNAFGSPIVTWGLPLTLMAHDNIFSKYSAVSKVGVQNGSLEVESFRTAYNRLPRYTLADLKNKLAEPMATSEAATIKLYTFKPDIDLFDLDEKVQGTPKLLQKESIEAQPRYQIELFLEATDVNAEFSAPDASDPTKTTLGKTTRTLTAIRLLVVAEEDLLMKITDDEEKLSNTVDNAIKRLEEAKSKLYPELSQLNRLDVDPKQLESSSVRMIGILQDVGRAKDDCQTLQSDINRVLRELEFNRFSDSIQNKWRGGYRQNVLRILTNEIPAAEAALGSLQTKLASGQRPTLVDGADARDATEKLHTALIALRKLFGDGDALSNRLKQLNMILNQQVEIQKEIAKEKDAVKKRLEQPSLLLTKQYPIKANQKTILTLPIQWGFYIPPKEGLRIQVNATDDSGLKVPASIIATDDRETYKLEIEAGAKLGVFVITLKPDVGEPAELRVEVQK